MEFSEKLKNHINYFINFFKFNESRKEFLISEIEKYFSVCKDANKEEKIITMIEDSVLIKNAKIFAVCFNEEVRRANQPSVQSDYPPYKMGGKILTAEEIKIFKTKYPYPFGVVSDNGFYYVMDRKKAIENHNMMANYLKEKHLLDGQQYLRIGNSQLLENGYAVSMHIETVGNGSLVQHEISEVFAIAIYNILNLAPNANFAKSDIEEKLLEHVNGIGFYIDKSKQFIISNEFAKNLVIFKKALGDKIDIKYLEELANGSFANKLSDTSKKTPLFNPTKKSFSKNPKTNINYRYQITKGRD